MEDISSFRNHISIVITIFLLSVSVPSTARVITEEEACMVAEQHMRDGMKSNTKSIVSKPELTDCKTLVRNGEVALYVFNRKQGGFIIVSADDASGRQILGWSENGCYNPENAPEQLKCILDSYASGIAEMRLSTRTAGLPSSAPLYANELPSSVSPLLGDIEWGQGEPYNLMCPTYAGQDGQEYHYATGCVATAIAQIMKFHEYPVQGRNSNSYNWRGVTLSADFSKSIYRWDDMRNNYNDGSQYSQEEAEAVALLMHDIGIACKMDYTPLNSGANPQGIELVRYFNYDKNLRMAASDKCTNEEWENILRHELSEGRPVLCEGGSQSGGHEFVCDGYNSEGLFHYNFGWDGKNNGWYASTATGYDSSPSIIYGIRPDNGGTGALSLHSSGDFKWIEGNHLEGDLEISCIGLEEDEAPVLEIGLAFKDVEAGTVSYFKTGQSTSIYLDCRTFDFTGYVPDGSYKVYPVGRIAGQEWQAFFHNSLYQIEVDLDVVSGVRTWQNSGITDPIDEGTVMVDNIYYILNEELQEATVTRRNSKGNSYSGTVSIPDEITYEGRTYAVTYIGENAFEESSELDSVFVGANVTEIQFGAFGFSGLRAIGFAKESKLVTIGGWAFNACSNLEEVILPEGTTYIQMSAFQSCFALKNIELPTTTYSVASSCFSNCSALESIHVKWTSLNHVFWNEDPASDGLTPGLVLYVPAGFAELYDCEPWTFFTVAEEGEVPPLEESYIYVLGCDGIWNPAEASCTLIYRSDGCYGGDITVTDTGDGYGYFCIGTVLDDDWSVFNSYRLGAPDSDYLLCSGEVCTYIQGLGNSFKAEAGTHHLVVDLNAQTIRFDTADGIVPIWHNGDDSPMYSPSGSIIRYPQHGQILIRDGHKYVFE